MSSYKDSIKKVSNIKVIKKSTKKGAVLSPMPSDILSGMEMVALREKLKYVSAFNLNNISEEEKKYLIVYKHLNLAIDKEIVSLKSVNKNFPAKLIDRIDFWSSLHNLSFRYREGEVIVTEPGSFDGAVLYIASLFSLSVAMISDGKEKYTITKDGRELSKIFAVVSGTEAFPTVNTINLRFPDEVYYMPFFKGATNGMQHFLGVSKKDTSIIGESGIMPHISGYNCVFFDNSIKKPFEDIAKNITEENVYKLKEQGKESVPSIIKRLQKYDVPVKFELLQKPITTNGAGIASVYSDSNEYEINVPIDYIRAAHNLYGDGLEYRVSSDVLDAIPTILEKNKSKLDKGYTATYLYKNFDLEQPPIELSISKNGQLVGMITGSITNGNVKSIIGSLAKMEPKDMISKWDDERKANYYSVFLGNV